MPHLDAIRYVALIAGTLACLPASAQLTLDQAQLDGSDQSRVVASNQTLTQTFVVGAAGHLAGVEISVSGSTSTPLRVGILDASAGVPGAPLLGEVSITGTELGPSPQMLDPDEITATYLDLTGYAIPIEAGDVLGIRLFSLAHNSDAYGVRLALSDAYPAGGLFSNEQPTTGDLAFKTFVTQLEPVEAVDQYQLNALDQSRAISDTASLGQSWRVGESGLLEGLEMPVDAQPAVTEPLLVEILDIRSGLDNAVLLGSVELRPEESLPKPHVLRLEQVLATYVDLTPLQLFVVEGDELAVRLSTASQAPDFWTLRLALADLYPDGALFGNEGFQSGSDAAFKTFVSTPLFGDDFETGNLSRWSQTEP